ncbi:MAG: MFS transporter [Burkholderiales bacterium]|nr:MFS transporter [Burkholderiales bacterium]
MMRSPWAPILGYYAIGVFAAAQLGKLSALAPLIAAELQLALPVVALAVSLLEAGGATLGAVAGLLAARWGLRPTLLGALLCLAAGGLGGAMAQGAPSLLAWRLLESLGYLGVIVTAPVLIALAALPARTGVALALWSSFVPVGLALGAWAWAGAAALSSWRMATAAGGVLAALALLACVLVPRAEGSAPVPSAGPRADGGSAAGGRARLPLAAWCLAASFGCYTLFEVGLLALLPSYLNAQAGFSVAEAGRWTALASLATLLGSGVAAWWVRRAGRSLGPMLVAVLLPALLLFGVFVGSPQGGAVVGLAVLLNAVSGVYPGLAFAELPRSAGGMAQMARANGLIAQFGASGSLLGPPLMAAFAERLGWPAAAWVGLAASLPCAGLAVLALRSARGAQQAGH